MKKASLLALDVFTKTEEDVRIRTKVGGMITLLCTIVTLLLLISEWNQFNTVVTRPQLVIDRDRNLKLDLNIDITFPSISCNLLSMDIMDDSGDIQLNLLESGFTKTRLDNQGNEIATGQLNINEQTNEYNPNDPDYCGPCYGSRDQTQNDKLPKEQRVCCQTCQEVRDAYANSGWAFYDGKNIEQCEREGYVDKVNKQINEGCRIRGNAQLNRIHGNIHFAPGKVIQNYRGHFHDTSLYDKTSNLNFKHVINSLGFGKKTGDNSNGPLDNYKAFPPHDSHFHQFSYYAKIVPTRFEYLNGSKIETTQFSVTSHDRPLRGGRDQDHPHTIHSTGGVPGLFIYFEMSPLKVINKEEHLITWSSFILNCITSIGGVLAVGTVIDKITYKAHRTIWGKKTQ